MSSARIRSRLGVLLNNYNMKICATNFQLGDKKVDVIGLDENGDIYMVFFTPRDLDAILLPSVTNELSEYIWNLFPFFDAFQSKTTIRIYAVTPTRVLNLEDIFFNP